MNQYLIYSALVVLACSFSQILLKQAATIRFDRKIQMFLNARVIIAYLILFSSTLLNARLIYQHISMTQISMAEALGYLFVPLLSFLLLKEKMKKEQIIGLILILLGITVYLL